MKSPLDDFFKYYRSDAVKEFIMFLKNIFDNSNDNHDIWVGVSPKSTTIHRLRRMDIKNLDFRMFKTHWMATRVNDKYIDRFYISYYRPRPLEKMSGLIRDEIINGMPVYDSWLLYYPDEVSIMARLANEIKIDQQLIGTMFDKIHSASYIYLGDSHPVIISVENVLMRIQTMDEYRIKGRFW